MTNKLNNFLETDHVELSKSPMFNQLVQSLNMTPQEQIEQMLADNDESLGGDAYEDIITSEYDSCFCFRPSHRSLQRHGYLRNHR